MKITSIIRFTVASFAVAGCVLVASSQPTVTGSQRSSEWPKHSMIPAQVPMSQVQEFKDAASLHLNDIQRNMGLANSLSKWTAIIDHTIHRGIVDTKFVVWRDNVSSGGVGGGVKPEKLSAAALATLYYTFDQGIDIIARNPKSKATASVSPNFITANIKPSDLGMTEGQVNQMVAQYVESHPMRFWNQARVGLASSR